MLVLQSPIHTCTRTTSSEYIVTGRMPIHSFIVDMIYYITFKEIFYRVFLFTGSILSEMWFFSVIFSGTSNFKIFS